MPGGSLRDVPARLSGRAGIVASVTALGLITLAYAVTQGSPIAHSPRRDWEQPTPRAATATSTTETLSPSGTSVGPSGARLAADLSLALQILLGLIVLSLVTALVVAIVRGWRARPRRQHLDALAPPPPVAQTVATGEADQRRALVDGAPTDAIIACWVELERAVAEAGIRRARSETTAELTLRVLGSLDTDRAALRDLADLYREARYSRHALTEEHRERAQRDLTDIHAALRARGPA
ncbi:DUF4129 domain-containing protein [Luteipulveratus flavus]|uniref:DUF4129 domain-containing protein n=1 Tax=Luteipulveratus flavus TaxID=3031728 RepID=A0ABT6C8V9_9MICO|nr:DUF4129 domain-containing protein [Luteipulveratus sp. YIM 133296]MDF8265357.1 DUF4129 domain-containing protein [Luteipulveratus sp. YIM 133296]